jgi:hypothetical protein
VYEEQFDFELAVKHGSEFWAKLDEMAEIILRKTIHATICDDVQVVHEIERMPMGRAIAQAVIPGLPPRWPGFDPRSDHVGSVVDKVAVQQVFSEYLSFPCQFSFHRLLHTHHLSSGAGTTGQLVADVASGLSLTPPQETKLKNTTEECLRRMVEVYTMATKQEKEHVI